MYNSISGVLSHKAADRVCVLTGGVEWDLAVSARASLRMPDLGTEVKVFTFLYHREDQLRLFGFGTERERALFLELLKVSGLGPRLAQRMLSGIDEQELVAALESEDVDALGRVPGVGRKTAQKIILTLKGKLALGDGATPSLSSDLIAALTSMGFTQRQASSAVAAALEEVDSSATGPDAESQALRRALAILGDQG